MTAAQVNQLCSTLINSGVGFTAMKNPDLIGDWPVRATPPAGTIDAKQLASIETSFNVTCPITTEVTFL